VFIYGGVRVIDGRITVGTFVAFMAYQMRVLPPLQSLMGMYANLATVRVSMRRVSHILDEPIEIVEAAGAAPLGASGDIAGDVVFDGVSLAFDGRAPIVEQLSFAARPGEVVAIVGPSGSGKSTVADLLLRLLDPDDGVVTLDGRDLRTIPLGDLRRAVGLVDQEPCILHATIAENIRYARPEATDGEVAEAAHAAALDRFIETLPRKYDTVVGERGHALSAGERQRLAAARVFLTNPAVLVLDEPTSALDPVGERQLAAGYERLMRGRTTIVITHRMELAERADRIVVLGSIDGQLVSV
jgi:ATP-binding cassette subfamily B protein